MKMGSFGTFRVFEGNSFTKPFALGGQESFSMGDHCLATPDSPEKRFSKAFSSHFINTGFQPGVNEKKIVC
jgi:hypothetical protein